MPNLRFSMMLALVVACACAITGAQTPPPPPTPTPTPATMPSAVSTAVSTIATATTLPTSAPAVISWDEAKNHIGQTAIVTGPVVGTHDFGDAAVLNVGKDYPSASRFTVYIPADKRKGMPDDQDQGKTITITGKIKKFHGVPEIEADPAHIVVAQQSTTAPTTQP